MFHRPLLLIVTALSCGTIRPVAAPATPQAGSPDDFWGLTNLYTFHLTIAPEQWAKMEKYESAPATQPFGERRPGGFGPGVEGGPQRGPGPMMGLDFQEGEAQLDFEGKGWGKVNVRFKGNSSFRAARDSLKRSLKLDFNDSEQGRTFFGMTKLNLNNGAMDPSVAREALGYEVFRHAGVPASRTAFARVYVTVPGKYDHAYAGLYTAVEQVDSKFLKAHFGAKSGLLLKPERVQGLPYLGEEWAAYERQFEEKSNVKPKEAKRFIAFTRLVNQAADPEFAAQIRSYMDVEAFLRFLAVQAALANLDSPLLTGHNYYLYLNPTTEKLAWIPWDLNEAFGGFMGGGIAADMAALSIHRPFTRANRLAERILALDGATNQYDAFLHGLITTNFTAQRLGAEMDRLAAVLREAVREDKQLSLAQFERHFAERAGAASDGEPGPGRRDPAGSAEAFPGGGGPVGFGPRMRGLQKPLLRQFVAERVASIESQLEGKSKGYEPVMNLRGGFGPNGPGQNRPGLNGAWPGGGQNGPGRFGPGGDPQPQQPRPARN